MTIPAFINDIDQLQEEMLGTVQQWASINSGSFNLSGLADMRDALAKAFSATDAIIEVIPSAPLLTVNDEGLEEETKLGDHLLISKRPECANRVLLVGHMDTVFPKTSSFQQCRFLPNGHLNGPGTADMKGGILVMLQALLAFEKSPAASQIGWDVILNSDEEIGSTGSAELLEKVGKKASIGMLFEPAMPDGTLAGTRKGSGNFTVVVYGKAAHAGREHHIGKNAIVALSEIASAIDALSGKRTGLTVNIGKIQGGGALNVVPDLAQMSFNVRLEEVEDQAWFRTAIEAEVAKINGREGYSAKLHGKFTRPPKKQSNSLTTLFDFVASCGSELGVDISYVNTGGCCDGNNLADIGLPNVDTLGVRGANIHSEQEYMIPESLIERAKLSALILHRFAENADQFMSGRN